MAATVSLVRTLVGDDQATEIKADSAYESIIAIETNEYKAAAMACRMLAGHFSQKVSTTIGQVKMSNQQKAQAYRELATEYDKAALTGSGQADPNSLGTPVVTGTSLDAMDAQRDDTDRYNSAFVRGMHDNPGTCACGCANCNGNCGCC